ncbi:MAG: IMPACT family protein [Flavobacteriales bacterium]
MDALSDYYLSLDEISTSTFKDRGSKFIALAMPVENEQQIKGHLEQIRKNHTGANHVCYAFIINPLLPYHRANDDGEPSSSAGKPILGQIRSANLMNVLVAVVRYFGGTQLGIPGLINAYKTSASDAIKANKIISKEILKSIKLQCNHSEFNYLMSWIKSNGIKYDPPDIGLFCNVTLHVSYHKHDHFKHQLLSIPHLQIID